MEGRNYAQQEAIVADDSDVFYKCQKSILYTVLSSIQQPRVHVALAVMASSHRM